MSDNSIEKAIVSAIEPVVDAVVELEKKVEAIQLTPGPAGADGKDAPPIDVESIKSELAEELLKHIPEAIPGKDGEPGKDADPVDIALALSANKEFIELITPAPAQVDPDEIASLIKLDGEFVQGLKGEKGDSAPLITSDEVAEALKADLSFIESLKAEETDPQELVSLLFEKHEGDLKGDGIKSVSLAPDSSAMVIETDQGKLFEISLPEGAPGKDGEDGAGIETKQWTPGIYREGSSVTHHIGKFYRALRDTNLSPGTEDWERIGTGGFAWKGLKDPSATYENGDLYIDGGSCFIWWEGKGNMFVQRGQRGAQGDKGADGVDGKDAPFIVAVKYAADGIHLAMSNGEVMSAEVDGLHGVMKEISQGAVQFWMDQVYQQIENEGGTPIRSFKGIFIPNQSYSVGDVVTYNKSVWVCKKATSLDYFDDFNDWRKMFSMGAGGGGGGGAGGGITRTTQILADGMLNMGSFGIGGLGNPRNGATGDADAVNKLYMQQAIAAGTLFQGVYRPAANAPDLGAKGDTGFTKPGPDTSLFAPPGAPLKPTDPKNVAIWFQVPDVTFPLVLAAPKHVSITLSNGQSVEFNVPAGTYADQNALNAAYLSAAQAVNPLILNMVVHKETGTAPGTGTLWFAVETLPAVFATSMSGQIGGGFPVLPPGAGNTILNSYSWNVQTTDPNLPEYLPAGIPGIAAGTKVNNSDLLQYNAGLQRFEIIRGGNLTQGFADNRYWQLTHGNMAWQDQAYDKGAVVYGVRFNAWFVSTQNIVPGSPEPGTTAAGALWRKINSTYGSTIFFGKGDYDTAPGHQDAAHNWGMPAGTYPAGQQPLNGDSYYDVTSGTEVQFTVTQNNPLFVITGVTTINATNQIGTLTNAQMDTFLPTSTPLVGQYYFYDAGTAHTALGGAFATTVFAAGHKYYIVWTGDKDADHQGWVAIDAGTTAPANGTTKNWSINTPHPQAVPDTITPKVVWGYKRNFHITIGGSVHGDDDNVIILKHIPDASGITHVELKHTSDDGATYEFEIIVSKGSPTLISPVAIDAHNSLFATINVAKDATNGIFIYGVTKQVTGGLTINGEEYLLEVTTYDYNTGVLEVGTGSELTTVTPTDTVSGKFDYPGAKLEKFFKDVQTGVARPYPLKQFDVIVGPASAGAEYFILFYGIPLVNAVTHVEMRRTDANGSTYEFDIISVKSGGCTISPIAVKNQDSQFLEIMAGWYDATYNYILTIKSKVKTTTETYQVTISSFDYDLDSVKPNSTLATPGAQNYRHDFFKADSAYPGRELTDILKAMSAHETASVAGMSAVLYGGSNTEGPQTCHGNAKEAFGIWGNTGPWIGTNFNSADTAQFFEEWDPFTNGSTGHWGIKSNAHLFVKFSIQGWFSASNASDGYLCLYRVTAANITAGHTERTNWEQLDYCPIPFTTGTYMHIDLCGQSEPGDVIFISQNTGSASLTLGQWFRQNVTGWKGQ